MNSKLKEVFFWKLIIVVASLFPILFFIRLGNYDNDKFFFTLFDDAMISMTYARTLIETGELVWFPGAERVQGFTNLLWTLYMSFLHSFGLNGTQVSLLISLTGLFCIFGSSFICGQFLIRAFYVSGVRKKTGGKDNIWVFIVVASILLLYPLIMWSLIGMEVGILSFLALSTLKCSLIYEDQETLEKRKLFFVLTLFTSITGILVRLDFSILVFVIFITQFFLSSKKRYLQLFTLTNAGFIVLTVLGILAFQFFYYGDFMPNTYRLKVDGYSIFDRVLNGVLTIRNITAILFLVFVVALIAIKEKKNVINKTIMIGSSVFLISCAYSIWVGGDAWERVGMANRFVSVTLPFAIISIFLGAYNFFKQTQLTVKCQNIYIFFVFLVTSCLLNFYPTRVITSNLIFLVALLLAVTYFCCKLYNCYIKKSGLNFQSRVILFLLIVILVSGRGWAMWIENGEIQSDYDYKNRGIYLKEITSDNAVIAVVTAGAQAYYSQRPMIDILGKSDKKIASVKPIGNFYPGHNKWDYDYSIGFLRPDVVAELWIDKDSDLVKKKLIQWGYVQKCYSNKLKGYFLEKSKAIRWSHLKNC